MYHVVPCPQCGHPAAVLDRSVLESTDGPVEHLRIECPGGHWFFMPAACLERNPIAPSSTRASVAS